VSSLLDLVESLKREIAVPGMFDAAFPDTTDDDLVMSLADGLAEAQLDGYFQTTTVDPDDNYEVTPDLSLAGGALIVIYAGSRILRAQLRALTSNQRYKAGNVEYETSRPANLLRDELLLLSTRKKELLTAATRSSGRVVYQLDAYAGRAFANWGALGAFHPYELA
jgi:hypothetical protein